MKINFWLNGAKKEAEISPDIMLLEFLRSLGCYSVKRGCETANCGLCTVLVNDKPMLSCSSFFPSDHRLFLLFLFQDRETLSGC